MRRGLHCGDQGFASGIALETTEFLGRDNDNFVASCTVTRCGPSLRTRRTSSLKRAFASCNSQWPDFGLRARRRGFVSFTGDFVFLVILTN
jgi:hypothetical protein